MNESDILLDAIYGRVSNYNWGYMWHMKRVPVFKYGHNDSQIMLAISLDIVVMSIHVTPKGRVFVLRHWPLERCFQNQYSYVCAIPTRKEIKEYKRSRNITTVERVRERIEVNLHEPNSLGFCVRLVKECWDLIRSDLRVINKMMYLSPHSERNRAYLMEAHRKLRPL